ncbi:unnamed protein product [Nesidiocoris tenuis]|uniref:Uncharacterized protein n=1 Tax=Nesidiocoris tenuis TaxID=355587 RepID=A0A6H5H8A7_9HEMI|nr:unnamed protein product [Nesidiocoris tenuis]
MLWKPSLVINTFGRYRRQKNTANTEAPTELTGAPKRWPCSSQFHLPPKPQYVPAAAARQAIKEQLAWPRSHVLCTGQAARIKSTTSTPDFPEGDALQEEQLLPRIFHPHGSDWDFKLKEAAKHCISQLHQSNRIIRGSKSRVQFRQKSDNDSCEVDERMATDIVRRPTVERMGFSVDMHSSRPSRQKSMISDDERRDSYFSQIKRLTRELGSIDLGRHTALQPEMMNNFCHSLLSGNRALVLQGRQVFEKTGKSPSSC